MLDPHYLQQIADGAENIASQLHEYIIRQIVDRMMIRIGRGDDYLLTSFDAWRIQVLQDSGYLLQDITAELAKYTKRQEKEIKAAICNYAIITSNVFNNSVIGFSLGDYIAFRVPRSLLPDWDENNPSNEPWVNWLKARKEAGNPVIVRYALKTPIERDLTPEEIAAYKALRTYGPTTVITNDAGTGMEVAYVVER